ncbi:MAG: TIGR03790 family protein [Verrucomicrobiales bacterium]|nr:TIGR03790 family protein [Verrucomicrobiales bacterium]
MISTKPPVASRFVQTFLGAAAACLGLCLLLAAPVAQARESGESVVVVYNRNLKESKEVADYYAERRSVPADQVVGLDLPTTETMTRDEYLQRLQRPLSKALLDAKVWDDLQTLSNGLQQLGKSKIRYAALCYGVPVKVLNDPSLKEAGAEKIPENLRRSDCAVDSQMTLLAWGDKAPWIGVIPNPFYGVTNALYMHPTNGILMVSRLDGPTPAIAKGLVDKAIQAETNGLWGRAYFDARGLTNGPYVHGDDWIKTVAQVMKQLGFETVLDETPITFTSGYPMSHVAFYAGWYDEAVSGPFTRPEVEFMPGAFAYHLHSFSAQVVRSATQRWVGPLLAKGVTATMGCVEEPYLGATPDLPAFFGRFVFFGNTFGEAASASQNSLSWQITSIGDPLYRPFWQPTDQLEKQLRARGSDLVAWSNLMEANQNLAANADRQLVIKFLQKSDFRHNPILQEKVANLFLEQKRFNLAAETFEEVLKTATSPGQRVRVLYALGDVRSTYGPDLKAYEAYLRILKENPDYPEKVVVYQKLAPLARRLGKREDEQGYNQDIGKLPAKFSSGASK